MNKNGDLIPSGAYCRVCKKGDAFMCPFWRKDSMKEMAKCLFLCSSDVLLDEFIKLCGVKTELEKERSP